MGQGLGLEHGIPKLSFLYERNMRNWSGVPSFDCDSRGLKPKATGVTPSRRQTRKCWPTSWQQPVVGPKSGARTLRPLNFGFYTNETCKIGPWVASLTAFLGSLSPKANGLHLVGDRREVLACKLAITASWAEVWGSNMRPLIFCFYTNKTCEIAPGVPSLTATLGA